MGTFEFRSPVDIPLWGDITMLIVVGFLLGFVVRDLIEVYKINRKEDKRGPR